MVFERTNMWVILKRFKQGNRNMMIIACPECKKEYRIRKTNYNRVRTCRVCRFVHQNRENFGKHQGYGGLTKTFYNHFKNAAKRRNVEFTVTVEELWKQAERQGFRCALSGFEITFPVGSDGNGNPLKDDTSASLDRIDSTMPYEKGNVQWVNKYINVMKNGFPQDEFIYLCHLVTKLHANPELSRLKGNKK